VKLSLLLRPSVWPLAMSNVPLLVMLPETWIEAAAFNTAPVPTETDPEASAVKPSAISVPPVIFVPPKYEFEPDRVRVPGPEKFNPLLPAMIALIVAETVEPTVTVPVVIVRLSVLDGGSSVNPALKAIELASSFPSK
jgi:hypothetical protein